MAAFKSTFPSYRARPTIQPLTPSASSSFNALTSSRELMPPEKMTSVLFFTRFKISLKFSNAGPVMVPSRLVSV